MKINRFPFANLAIKFKIRYLASAIKEMIKVGLKSHIIKQLLILFRWTFYPILGIP